MKCDKKTMLLYAVTDKAWVGKQSLYEQVASALKGGATCVQLRDICAAVDIPVVAIGGIDRSNISLLAGTGVDGVALVSAIFAAKDIENECRLLRRLSEKMVNAG